ncbi:MAG: redox-sensing transcriptional repressor Rex, partial [Desulfovibrio sp.]|nr:redox-sensing transcriptional repressor Rex [Desulfovibrio sp.]
MDSQPKSMHIPRATIRRLATYVQVLENLAREGTEIISSNPLAEACGVNGSQIRKDLAYFGEFGIRGVGYNVTSLMAAITSALDVDREWKMALIGVGNLGKALLNHSDFRARNFNIVSIFD